jgi:hypothetical protein
VLSDEDESEDGDYDSSEDNAARDACRVKLQAAYLQATQGLSEEELEQLGEAVLEPRRSDAAQPVADFPPDVLNAFAILLATGTGTSYWKSFADKLAADAFVLAFLAKCPFLVEQILDRTREVQLDSLEEANENTGIYVIETTAPKQKVMDLARSGSVSAAQRAVFGKRLQNAPGEVVTVLYGGQSAQNEERMKTHKNGKEQLCDKTAHLLERQCDGATKFYGIITVAALVALAEQTGVTAKEAMNLAEVAAVAGLKLMESQGGLNVADPGCVSVSTSVSAAGGRAVRPAGGRSGGGNCGNASTKCAGSLRTKSSLVALSSRSRKRKSLPIACRSASCA